MRTLPARLAADAFLGRGAADAVAVIDGDRHLDYAALRSEVDVRGADLALGERSTVVLAGPASAEWIVTYLALLQEGHVPLLVGDHVERVASAWHPDAVITVGTDRTLDVERIGRPGDRVEPHPDLALLLSTSGSTGSPKLVRLSHQNLTSNADAIVAALGLTAEDCGVTSLPLHYCYGLSVLHSHLAAGARIVTANASVVDPCFRAAVRRNGVTSIAGVPHTFDLLEASDPDRAFAPSVRLLTQAGGRMDPDARERWRSRAADHGADLVVMYGQTEATARMAYLPPHLAASAPGAVGIPIPGGKLRVDPIADRSDGVGELVYSGPNVMMGYASEPDHLALGPTTGELRTGDLGRFDAESGVFEVVGRVSRFIKPFGLRIDLDAVECQLGAVLGPVVATGDDERLVIAVPGQDPATVLALVGDLCGLPDHRVTVLTGPIPRTPSGKVDGAALRDEALRRDQARAEGRALADDRVVSAVLAEILGRPALDPTDSFVSAGGDSLSYIEASMRLEQLVGRLPDDWQHRPVRELDELGTQASEGSKGGTGRVDTTVLLRAAGICAVVATHMHLTFFPGGAHLLLAVVGYNLSRFQLSLPGTAQRLRAGARTIARVAVPTMLWAAAMFALGRSYGWTTIGLVNNYLGPRGHHAGLWHFWFIEAFVQLCAVTVILMAIPAIRRLDLRLPYAFPMALLAAAVALREVSVAGIDDPFNLRFRTHGVAAFFVLGWLVHRSRTRTQKVVTTALCLMTVVGFFGQPPREAFIVLGLVLLTWLPSVAFPRPLIGAVSALAAASMWILISHFQVWPTLDEHLPIAVAYPLTLAVGIGIWKLVDATPRWVRRRREAPAHAMAPVVEAAETARVPIHAVAS